MMGMDPASMAKMIEDEELNDDDLYKQAYGEAIFETSGSEFTTEGEGSINNFDIFYLY
jgi:hypothetical protein